MVYTSARLTFGIFTLLFILISYATYSGVAVYAGLTDSVSRISSADPLQFSLEGLTRSPSVGMTSGSLGGWNENDWVPLRLTTDNSQGDATSFEGAIEMEYANNGMYGIDAFANCFSPSAADCGSGSTPGMGGSAMGTGHMWSLMVGSGEQTPTVTFGSEPGGVQTIRWNLPSVAVPAQSSLTITWAVHLAKGNSPNLACMPNSPMMSSMMTCSPANVPQGEGEAAWPGRSLQVRAVSPSIPGERTVSIDVAQQTQPSQPRCIIATAAYGSELAAPVQFLRGFRDNQVASTYLGKEFLTAFNAWYYSWAPIVAGAEAPNPFLRAAVRFTIMPLLVILFLANSVFVALAPVNAELAIMTSGLLASALLGLAYMTPFFVLFTRARKMLIRLRTLFYLTISSATLTLVATIPHGTVEPVQLLVAFAVIEVALLSPALLTMKLQNLGRAANI